MNLFTKISSYFIPSDLEKIRIINWKAKCFVNIVVFCLLVVILSFILVNTFSISSEFHHVVCIVSFSSVLLVFKITRSFNIACNLLAATIFFVLEKDIMVQGGLYSFGNAYLVAIPFLMYIFTNNWMGHVWTGIICLSMLRLYKLEVDVTHNLNILSEIFNPDFQIAGFVLFFIFLLGLVFIVSKSQGIIIDELNEKKKNLESHKEKLEQLKIELIRSNQELEIYAQAASHDLKQPIRTINSFGKLLQRELNGSMTNRAKEYLGFIIDGSLDMNEMVSEMLDYSKMNSLENTKFEVIDPKKLLTDLQLKLRDQIETKNVKIIVHEMPEKILGQKTRVSQLFQNLISNAIKFQRMDVPLRIDIRGVEELNCWHFTVEDNGIGIDKVYHEKIFELFRKLHSKSTYNGSGIGLATCKKIAQMHNGDIWVNSAVGRGACFQFTICKKIGHLN